MTSPSSASSATASQTPYSEVTNQALMSLIVELRTELASMSQRQNQLMQLVLDLQRQPGPRVGPTTRASRTVPHPTPGPTSTTVPAVSGPMATDSVLSPGQSAESATKPQTNRQTIPPPAPGRELKRQNAFYHIPGATESPWKAPGGCHPDRDGKRPTCGTPTPERPESPSPLPHHSPVSRPREPDSRDEDNHLPSPILLSPFRLPTPQGSQPSPSLPAPPLPQASGSPTFPLPEAGAIITTLPTRSTPTPRTHPLHVEGAFCEMWFGRAPFISPGPGFFQPPPFFPLTAPTTPVAAIPSPKRKREDAGDTVDGDQASNKKRARRPSSDDID